MNAALLMKPQEGCAFATLPLGAVDVLVEYEHEAGEAASWDDPGEPEALTIIGVFINGAWTDPDDWLDDRILAKWTETLREQCADAAVQAREADEVAL